MKKMLFILLFFLCVSCSEESKSKKNIIFDEPKDSADQISYNFLAYFIDSSFTKAKLTAYQAKIYSSKKETILDSNVKVNFFSKKNEKQESYMTADSVIIDDITKNMTAFGKVFVMSETSKANLRAKVLIWDNNTQKLTSNSYVTYTSKYETISGWGFESDQNLENYKFTKVAGIQK